MLKAIKNFLNEFSLEQNRAKLADLHKQLKTLLTLPVYDQPQDFDDLTMLQSQIDKLDKAILETIAKIEANPLHVA